MLSRYRRAQQTLFPTRGRCVGRSTTPAPSRAPILVLMRVLIATDGSELAIHAASEAPALLAADATFVVATVIAPTANPEDDAGGFEGPAITAEEAADDHRSRSEERR